MSRLRHSLLLAAAFVVSSIVIALGFVHCHTARLPQRAEQAWQSGNLPLAARLYRQLLSRQPTFWLAHLRLGQVAQRAQPRKAESYLSHIPPTDPSYEEAQLLLARIGYRGGRHWEALQRLRRLVERGNANGQALYLIASVLQSQGQLQEASRWAQKLLERWPGRVVAYELAGQIEYELGNRERLPSIWRRALEISSNPIYRLNLAESLLWIGELEECQRQSQLFLQAQPDSARALYCLALSAFQAGRLQESHHWVERLLQADPQLFKSQLLHAELLLTEGQLDAAEAALQELRRSHPASKSVNGLLADLYRRQGDAKRAGEYVRQHQRLDAAATRLTTEIQSLLSQPHDDRLRVQIAKSFLELGEPEDARRWLDRALALNPRNREALELKQSLPTEVAPPRAASTTVTRAKQTTVPSTAPRRNSMADSTGTSFRFVDVAAEMEIGFQHFSGKTKEQYVHQVMGGGVAWLDFDNDGWLDLFFTQGAGWPLPEAAADTHPCALLRRVDRRFADVTGLAGAASPGYCYGVGVSDFDNDGFADVYISQLHGGRLLHNQGDGTFRDITTAAGLQGHRWGTSLAWFDADCDGDLDLFVASYIQVDLGDYRLCGDFTGSAKIYSVCHPSLFPGEANRFYRNLGDGTFRDDSQTSGVAPEPYGKGLGVVACDVDNDNDIDLYVTNDAVPNELLLNRGSGQFEPAGVLAGVAYNRHGAAEAGMGVDAADIDHDGLLDLVVGNYYLETVTVYHNHAGQFFSDISPACGIAAPSRMVLTFGALFLDVDRDGWHDLFTTNGHLDDQLPLRDRDVPYRQQPQVYRNQGDLVFRDVSKSSGTPFQLAKVGRGCAAGDFDNDGDPDVVVANMDGTPSLLRNDTDGGKALCLSLVGRVSNRDAFGCKVKISAAGQTQTYQTKSGASYLSSGDSRLLVGLGTAATAAQLEILWPSGHQTVRKTVSAKRELVIVEQAESGKSAASRGQ